MTFDAVGLKLTASFSKPEINHHHHHHISVMELGHLLARSGLTHPEVSSKVCHDSFCQLGNRPEININIKYET
jgi:hypothetical protein